ncbi:MAG: hypothetical protein AABY88_13090 [Pseudomonadota bacterium]
MIFAKNCCVLLSLALVTALPVNAVAQTSAKACLSSDEAEGLVTYALPATVRALSAHCAKTLPATAPLVQSGIVTAARYQIDADRAWPVASSAFDKLSGLPVAKLMGEKALKPFIEKTISGGVTQNFQPRDCVKADHFINILQPLPTRNMALLITALVEIGSPATRAKLPISLCTAPVSNAPMEASSK